MNAPASKPAVIDLHQADFAKEVEQASTPVFIDFWAPWCGPCVALAPTFDALAETYGDQIKFVKANFDDNQELVQRFGIRGIPHLLLFKDGQIVERVVGGRPKAYLSDLLSRYAQRPVVAASKPARSFRAFYGDAGLRQAVVERVRGHIEAGRITPSFGGLLSDADQQRYSLMGAVLETADTDRFEGTLGIPASVGHLQQAAHGLGTRLIGKPEDIRFGMDAPQSAWPLDWWQAVPLGADLQSLPSRFLDAFLRELAEDKQQYPVEISDTCRSALRSLAQLHARVAQGDVPTVEEWRAVRAALKNPLLERRTDDAGDQIAEMFERGLEGLAWPADEMESSLGQSVTIVVTMHLQATANEALRKAYTPEQWAEREARQKAFADEMQTIVSAVKAPEDLTPEIQKKLEECRARMRADTERSRPFEEGVTSKVTLSFGERLHAGLMQALSATTSPAH